MLSDVSILDLWFDALGSFVLAPVHYVSGVESLAGGGLGVSLGIGSGETVIDARF